MALSLPIVDRSAAYDANLIQQEQYTPCDRCGVECAASHFCHSCANAVCSFCHIEDEACCIDCIQTFPKSPHASMLFDANLDMLPTPMHGTVDETDMEVMPPTPQIDPCNLSDNMAMYCSPWMPEQWPIQEQTQMYQNYPVPTQMPTFAAPTPYVEPPPVKPAFNREHFSSSCSTNDSDSQAADDKPTTMMVTNIPCRFGQKDIEEAIDSVGFAGTYDFLYIPKRKCAHEGNIGYAFVNFKTPEAAERFVGAFHNYQFSGSKSTKRCAVKVAYQQGHNALLKLESRGVDSRRTTSDLE